jgi:hypothetical protein
MTRSFFAVIFTLSLLFFLSCNSPNKNQAAGTSGPSVKTPTQEETDAFTGKSSAPVSGDVIDVPGSVIKTPVPTPNVNTDPCDGKDNDKDGLFDENCYGCCVDGTFSCYPGRKSGDFDGNGTVTKLECMFPMLAAYGKTIAKNNIKCADLNKDGKVDFNDTLECFKIVNATVATTKPLVPVAEGGVE